MMVIRVVLADDHWLFRQGLCTLLHGVAGIEVIGEACSGEEAVVKARDLRPDIVLMDLEMPGMNGIVATQLISEQLPQVKVLVLSAHDDGDRIYAAMKAGARGYILKRIGSTELVNILRATQGGETFVSPYLAQLALQDAASSSRRPEEAPLGGLTAQERQVLQLVVDGLSNDAIADTLHISKDTAKAHIKHIFEKLQVNNRTRAAVLALKHGLIR